MVVVWSPRYIVIFIVQSLNFRPCPIPTTLTSFQKNLVTKTLAKAAPPSKWPASCTRAQPYSKGADPTAPSRHLSASLAPKQSLWAALLDTGMSSTSASKSARYSGRTLRPWTASWLRRGVSTRQASGCSSCAVRATWPRCPLVSAVFWRAIGWVMRTRWSAAWMGRGIWWARRKRSLRTLVSSFLEMVFGTQKKWIVTQKNREKKIGSEVYLNQNYMWGFILFYKLNNNI